MLNHVAATINGTYTPLFALLSFFLAAASTSECAQASHEQWTIKASALVQHGDRLSKVTSVTKDVEPMQFADQELHVYASAGDASAGKRNNMDAIAETILEKNAAILLRNHASETDRTDHAEADTNEEDHVDEEDRLDERVEGEHHRAQKQSSPRRRCDSGLSAIPADAKMDFNSNDYKTYVKDCPCDCKNANANEYSGTNKMIGTTVSVWKARTYSFPWNRVCSCAMVMSTSPRWNVQYHNGKDGWSPLTPGTCYSGTNPADDDSSGKDYYRACFARDMCLLETNSQSHCAYLLPSGIMALLAR